MAKGKAKLPKKVAGVKIPKKLRKAGGAARDLLDKPVVSEMVAAAMMAAAASLADSRSGRKARAEVGDAASEAMKQGAAIGDTVKRALLDAAHGLLDSVDEAVTAMAAGDRKGSSAKKG